MRTAFSLVSPLLHHRPAPSLRVWLPEITMPDTSREPPSDAMPPPDPPSKSVLAWPPVRVRPEIVLVEKSNTNKANWSCAIDHRAWHRDPRSLQPFVFDDPAGHSPA